MKKLLVIALILLALFGCKKEAVKEDEFVVRVSIDTDDREICVLHGAYMLDGELIGGRAVSEADNRTPLKGTYWFDFRAEDFPEDSDISNFSIVFLTEYDFSHVNQIGDLSDAHYVENEISFKAEWGKQYDVSITGSREKGYKATLTSGEETERTDVKVSDYLLQIKTADGSFEAVLEENSSAEGLVRQLEKGPVKVNMSDYGNFEKVGSLPWSITRNDTRITTSAGDVILYQGNQITIYYDQNTWSFTRLAHIEGATRDSILAVLGKGDVTVEFSIIKK